MMNQVFVAFLFSLVSLTPVSAQVRPSSDQRLISPETQVDYTPLKNQLANQQWRAANEKTAELILEAANRDIQGWLSTDDILNLACWDLKTIDDLWQQYSQGRFGFTPQFAIFIKNGNRPGRLMAIENYEAFGDEVGWRAPDTTNANNQQAWIIFKENINYSLEAPVGHLPQIRQAYNLTGNRLQFTNLAKRLIDCNIVSVPKPEVMWIMSL